MAALDKKDTALFPLVCESPEDWRGWLQAHHAQAAEAWLLIRKKNSLASGIHLEETVDEALCFGWIDGKLNSLEGDSFLLRFTPRRPGSLWSLRNRRRAETLIVLGRMTEAGLAAIRQAQENGNWQNAYTSKVSSDLPEDLSAALHEDSTAEDNFRRWSSNQKLQAAMWVTQSKQHATRDARIRRIVHCAHEGVPLSAK